MGSSALRRVEAGPDRVQSEGDGEERYDPVHVRTLRALDQTRERRPWPALDLTSMASMSSLRRIATAFLVFVLRLVAVAAHIGPHVIPAPLLAVVTRRGILLLALD
jgi:hypothetical protein